MTRVIITGSSGGLGLIAARLLIAQGHEVIARAKRGPKSGRLRSEARRRGSRLRRPRYDRRRRTVAGEVNKLGRFDAVIHNAGLGYREGRVEMEPGVPSVFGVNALASTF